MEYRENCLTYEDYIALRSAVGWQNLFAGQTEAALPRSTHTVTAVEQGQTIAMGRLIGDGLYYLMVDVVVHPAYQGRGIGSGVVDRLLQYVEDHTPAGGRSSVQLIAEQGKEPFYVQKGFKLIPHAHCGSGMRKVIRK